MSKIQVPASSEASCCVPTWCRAGENKACLQVLSTVTVIHHKDRDLMTKTPPMRHHCIQTRERVLQHYRSEVNITDVWAMPLVHSGGLGLYFGLPAAPFH
jgi:hypothetical protein